MRIGTNVVMLVSIDIKIEYRKFTADTGRILLLSKLFIFVYLLIKDMAL